MYKNTMIKFHRIAVTHPVFSKYIIDGIHDLAQQESQKHLLYTWSVGAVGLGAVECLAILQIITEWLSKSVRLVHIAPNLDSQ